MDVPAGQGIRGSGECLCPGADRHGAVQVVITGWEHAFGCSHLGVGQVSFAETVRYASRHHSGRYEPIIAGGSPARGAADEDPCRLRSRRNRLAALTNWDDLRPIMCET